MKSLLTLAGAGIILTAASAHAQDMQDPAHPEPEPVTSPEPVQPQSLPPSNPPPSDPPPSDMDPVVDTPSFTDEQIAGFASAAMQMRELNSDTQLDETARRAQAELVIADEGLDPETYSAIGEAAGSDPAIAVRVQQAIEAMMAEPEG